MPFLVICFFFGLAGGVVGKIKGSSFFLWFLLSAIPPYVGLIAAVVLAIAAWILFKVIIGVVAAIAWFVVAVVAIIAVIWAVRTLF